MSFISDLRTVSESAMEQLADRFSELPRPLLAAIGAGDMAIERFAELRDVLQQSIPTTPPESAEVMALAGDLPARAQKAAADVVGSLEQFASQAPAKAQEMISELPGKMSGMVQSLSPDTVRETVGAYTHLADVIYGNLAIRGGKTWSKMRSIGLPFGSVVESAATAPPSGAAQPATSAPFPKDPHAGAGHPVTAPQPTSGPQPTAAPDPSTTPDLLTAPHPVTAPQPVTPSRPTRRASPTRSAAANRSVGTKSVADQVLDEPAATTPARGKPAARRGSVAGMNVKGARKGPGISDEKPAAGEPPATDR